jgi:ABC-type multidrug transport system fused ATPase/permease subunit
MKDQVNKAAHEESAQVACEAAGAIRTVASLTREDDCIRIYSKSLEEPLRRSNRTAFWSNMLFAISQAITCVSHLIILSSHVDIKPNAGFLLLHSRGFIGWSSFCCILTLSLPQILVWITPGVNAGIQQLPVLRWAHGTHFSL